MIGQNKDTEFDFDNYEEFYEHHRFVPIPEKDAFNANEIVPRFGWGLDQIASLGAQSLLDLGCLDGSFALTVASQLGISVVGVDLTEDGINLANDRAGDLDAEFYQGTIEEYLQAFIDAGKQFEVVSWFEIIEHVKDVQLVIDLIDQVLVPGGSVLVSTPAFESPIYGANDEQNKCHIRLYTLEPDDYEAANKFGNVRKATSIYKEIGPKRIREAVLHNELINLRYQ